MKKNSLVQHGLAGQNDLRFALLHSVLEKMMILIWTSELKQRKAWAIAAAIAAIFIYSTPVAAAPARCDVDIAGFDSYHGVCDLRSENDGSFSLRGKNFNFLIPTLAASYDPQESVYVKMVSPGIALLFGVGGAHETGQYLATVYQQGGCWVSKPPNDSFNGDARVCAK